MRPPWRPLSDCLALPFGVEPRDGDPDAAEAEAWTETAARLGLTRLGWRPGGAEGRFELSFPCERALVKARTRGGLAGDSSDGVPRGTAEGSDEVTVRVSGGILVAAAPSGALPPSRSLQEVGTLAAALSARRGARQRLRRAERAASQGRNAAAAAHDLRNELTRAVLHARRAGDGDQARVLDALESARELAQTALGTRGGAATRGRPSRLELKRLLLDEAAAAVAAARTGSGAPPGLRLKCPSGLTVLAPRSALSRAVRNLITNALEAAARAGRPAGKVTIEVTQDVSWSGGLDLELIVRDDGVGMGAAEIGSFLEGSARSETPAEVPAEVPADGKPASTGLGTASLRLALGEIGARLRISSLVGRGTEARLQLRSVGEGAPVLVVDPDLRRAEKAADRLGGIEGRAVWIFSTVAGALPLARAGEAHSVHSHPFLAEPERRAELARACGEGGVPLIWSVQGRHATAMFAGQMP